MWFGILMMVVLVGIVLRIIELDLICVFFFIVKGFKIFVLVFIIILFFRVG